MINNVLMAAHSIKALSPIADGSTNPSTTSAVPTMTSNTTPSGVVSASSNRTSYSAEWGAFDGAANTLKWQSVLDQGAPQYLQYQFPTAKAINKYSLNGGPNAFALPISWTIHGSNNGSSWTLLDTRSNQTFSGNTDYYYSFTNGNAYKYYKITATSIYYEAPNYYCIIDVMKLIECQYA